MKLNKTFCIREYGYLLDGGEIKTHNAVSIPRAAFKSLLSDIHNEENETDVKSFIKLTTYKRKPAIKVQNYVGVLRTPCGTQIEILPKLYNHSSAEDTPDNSRNQLLTMLRTLKNSPFKQAGVAHIREEKIPLLEVYITQFLSLVNELIKRGIRSDYVRVKKNAKFLKGRLMVGQQIRKNYYHQERFFVEYEEYQINRPANRLIKTALSRIIKITSLPQNQRLARELSFVFDEVPLSVDTKADFMKIKKDRSMSYYSEVLGWCRLLLNEQGPATRTGKFATLTLLYPMERIFEDYVAYNLRKDIADYYSGDHLLKPQVKRSSLVENHKGKPIFNLRPDILIKDKEGKNICIMDTKWKLIDEGDRSSKYGISQADMYQLYAYGHKYLKEKDEKNLKLIFPKTDTFTKPLPVFIYEAGFKLEVVPFDVKEGKLIY